MSARSRSRLSSLAGHEVIVLDDLTTGHRVGGPRRAQLSTTARTPTGRELARLLASETRSRRSFTAPPARSSASRSREPSLYFRDNVAGGIALLEAMRAAGVGRLVFSSTAAVYGDPGRHADPRGRPAPSDQPVRRDEAHVRGRAGLVRRRPTGSAASSAPLLQRRRRDRDASARSTTRRPTSSRTSCPRPRAARR